MPGFIKRNAITIIRMLGSLVRKIQCAIIARSIKQVPAPAVLKLREDQWNDPIKIVHNRSGNVPRGYCGANWILPRK
jgi:hypothetical protein